ncbi:MAG: signal peptidase [Planctomycetes bacterium]|nr:signal peptidase [Planctomycetota bacterium]
MTENNQAQKPKQDKNKKYILVRYGLINLMGWFEHNEKHIPKKPTRVIVKTERGLELGCIVGNMVGYKAGHFKMTKEQLQEYYEDSEIEFQEKPAGRLLRIADEDDINEEKHLRQIVKEETQYCKKCVEELELPMKIVSAEHIFGGERVIFYFMSESRVDFRELVKKIAHEYQTRIEMRQIGARDEAKLLGDYETCGQQCCCQKFLKVLKPVNMRMAKMQKATLDPSKISGYCGRLKCCLRYEDQTYTQLKRNLPRKNTPVKTPQGKGKVINTQILTQLVMVLHDNGERAAVPLEDIKIITPEEAAAENGNDKQQDNKAEKSSDEKTPDSNNQNNSNSNGDNKQNDNENGKRRGNRRRNRRNNKNNKQNNKAENDSPENKQTQDNDQNNNKSDNAQQQ